jgi:XTP/dITP diphosphohydrolase
LKNRVILKKNGQKRSFILSQEPKLSGQVVLASQNEGKLKEFRKLLKDFPIQLLKASDFMTQDVPETGKTFRQNALIKAKAVAQASGLPALADDSGFCLKALNDAPGIYTAWFIKENGSVQKAAAVLNDRLEGLSKEACFICVLALVLPSGEEFIFEGKCSGDFVYPPRGENGFGFDIVFRPNGYEKFLLKCRTI